jgi:hypothetical protein
MRGKSECGNSCPRLDFKARRPTGAAVPFTSSNPPCRHRGFNEAAVSPLRMSPKWTPPRVRQSLLLQ